MQFCNQAHLVLNQLQVQARLPPRFILVESHSRFQLCYTPGSSSATTPGTSSVESTPGTSTGSCWVSVSTGGYGYETTVTICSDVTSGQSVTTPTTISVPSTFCTTVPTAGTDETVITVCHLNCTLN